VQETVGRMLKEIISPILTGLNALYEWYLKLPPAWQGIIAGLVSAVPVIITVTTVLTALTAAINALKVAINPVAGIIGIVVGALSALGFAYASTRVATHQVKEATEELTATTEKSTQAQHKLQVAVSATAESLAALYEDTKKAASLKDTDTIRRNIEELDSLIKLKIEDSKAVDQTLASLLAQKRAWNEVLWELNDKAASTNEERRKKQQQADSELSDLQQKYNLAVISDAVERTKRELEIERDAEIQRVQSLKASEELILQIKQVFASRIQEVDQKAAEEALKAEEVAEQDRQRQIEAEQRQQNQLESEVAAERNRQQQIVETRADFEERGLELSGNNYQAEMNAIDRFYERKHDKLIEAGYTEAEITEQTEAAKEAIRSRYNRMAVASIANTLSTLGNAVKDYGKSGFAAWKAMSIASTVVDTYSGATAAYKAMAGIPIVGPALGIAAAAAAIASGLANLNAISKTKYEPAKAAKGGLTGLLIGKSHAQGGTLIEAEGDEYIVAKDRVRMIGQRVLDFFNFGPIHQVQAALAGIPTMTVPAVPRAYYADGGSVLLGSGTGYSILEEIRDSIRAMNRNMVNLDTGTCITVETSDPDARVRRDAIRRNKMTARGEQYDPSL
jgi:hypothetical protein